MSTAGVLFECSHRLISSDTWVVDLIIKLKKKFPEAKISNGTRTFVAD